MSTRHVFLVPSYNSSEAWTTYTRQEKELNSFHLRCLRRILDISWQDKITNTEVLERASSFSLYTLLSQRRLRWLGHVHRMANGRIRKDMLYGELVTGTRTVGRPYLRYRESCKRDMKVAGIDITTWEVAVDEHGHWRAVVKTGMERADENRSVHEAVKREKRKQKYSHPAHPPTAHCRSSLHCDMSMSNMLQRSIAVQAYTVTCPCPICSNGILPFKLTL